MIFVVATIEIFPGMTEDFLEQFHRIVPLVYEEAGCIEYGPAEDLPTDLSKQAPVRSDVIVIFEKWETLDHLKAHLAAPHMNEYREKVKTMVKNSTLQIMKPV